MSMAPQFCENWKRTWLARRPGCRLIRSRHFGSQITDNPDYGSSNHNANARDTLLASPADSGYGSVDDEQHLASPTLRRRSPPAVDGPGSWDEPEGAAEATLHRTTTVLPRGRPHVSSSSRRREGGSARLLDRFVPLRDHSASTTERYHTAKQPRALSPSERLTRHGAAFMGPFAASHWREAGTAIQSLGAVSMAAASYRLRTGGGNTTTLSVTPPQQGEQLARHSTLETVGSSTFGDTAVDDGHGHLLRRGTNARLFASPSLVARPSAQDDLESYHGRVAYALDIDRIRKILDFGSHLPAPSMQSKPCHGPAHLAKPTWGNNEWPEVKHCESPRESLERAVPRAPFRVLDAPSLRDDYYCSVLAYSTNCQTLAVGLGNVLYTWSEGLGVRTVNGAQVDSVWLTSIAFSSSLGKRNILAAGRSDGTLILTSIQDGLPRFEVQQPYSITCLGWRPLQTEDLVVGDGTGTLYYYAVEWPMGWEVSRDTWPGSMSLVAKICLHSQQICGLAWSPDGQLLASGGNDNLCYLLDVNRVLGHNQGADTMGRHRRLGDGWGFVAESLQHDEIAAGLARQRPTANETTRMESGAEVRTVQTTPGSIRTLGPGCETQLWVHRAAVKAIAFCPWRNGLVATGGGSNDKCIHFFHTSSGSALATIAVAAQVTSLI
ncbi:WD domain-containing protein [Hirsutella rhossiliensis]|uniref:WD domain-containing protein n=1 Tax=Hirsutella rhossiliensis TaxID=111463 RepID=A0A9P8MWY3_9HYPO|nr:WD domain-containing protein [Hirsutella rhossiliensis]KAH0960687.1 WD domain-containing protein [Hirsutella rhossiliensis]